MTKKRLLIISNRYPAGIDDTASPFVYDFRKALEKYGIDLDIVTPYYKPSGADTSFLDGHVHPFEWSDGSKVISQLPLWNPSSFLKIKKYFDNGYQTAKELVEQKRYDGIIALWALPSGYIARKISREFDIPYGIWALGSDINSWGTKPFLGKITVDILKNADVRFADGYELAMKVKMLSNKGCRFLPSFHNIHFIKPATLNNEKYFLCFGRVEKAKGVFDLLQSFKIFLTDYPEWKLYYIGIGTASGKLRKEIKKLDLQSNITLLGYLEREKVNHYLSGATAVIIPSHSDSLPLTFGEAMQAGRPVITSDVGDMPYFVIKYRVGYHFPVGDIAALAEKMQLMTVNHVPFSFNCEKVPMELNIDTSAAAFAKWLESQTVQQESKSYEYTGTR
jgi:glycosyltransferase involved in cell wall biosynthesis